MNLITHNWNLKLMALVLAVVLWGHVRSTVNPWETATFLVRLRSSPPPKMILADAAKIPDTVKVTVGGPRLNLRQIKGVALANPLSPTGDVTSVTGGQVRATLDFSLARKGRQDVPVKAETSVEDVEVIGVNPANVEVVLDPATSAQVAVRPQLASRLAAGLRLEKVTVQPAPVSVSGPSEALARVAAARGRTVQGVTLEPRTARIVATLRAERVTRRLRVIARMQGEPAPGYRILSTEVTPSYLGVSGPLHALGGVASLTLAVDVAGATTTLHRQVAAPVPRGLTPVGTGRVAVRVRIAPLEGSHRETPGSRPIAPVSGDGATRAPANGLSSTALPH
ncbi:MAG TPA: hypothetical protein VNA16_05885 [Abditibacteriaceae bacterium]|nr:hypothetical protein [Abditibacteriaceae bacterium]